MGRVFRIIAKNHDQDLVKEENLEKVLCRCGGHLKIVEGAEDPYGLTRVLECQSCHGRYGAREER